VLWTEHLGVPTFRGIRIVRKPYPSDVSDEEWGLVAPYLCLLPESAEQRHHPLREVFNGLRYLVRYGIAWRAMPNDLPPWHAVYEQAQRWLKAGCFEVLAQDLRAVLRLALGRQEEPTAAVLDSRTLRSTPESGHRAAWNGHKRMRGSKVHMAVDTLGHLLALHVTPANVDDRAAVAELAEAVQAATGESVDLAYVDQGYTGDAAAEAAQTHGIRLEVVKLPNAKRGFVLLPRRWVAERSFAWMARFRRFARDYERLPDTLAGLHIVGFVITLLRRAADLVLVHNTL
jgi:transposase